MLNKLPLRIRLTIITTVIITSVCILLTLTSNFNAVRVINNIPMQKIVDSSKYNQVNAIKLEPSITPPENTIKGQPTHINNNYLEAEFINIANTTEAKKIATTSFAYDSLIYMGIIILLGALVTYIIVGKALQPVVELNNKIKNINENNLNERIRWGKSNDELSELANSFNTMLGRIESAFESKKRFTSNAAHELRTPLANMQTNIEVFKKLNNTEKEDYEEMIDVFERNTFRLKELVDDLFSLCNNESIDFNQKVDFPDMLEDIKKDLQSSMSKFKVNVIIEEGIKNLYGSKILLHRVFFNLIENGIKYNKPNGSVIVSSEENDKFIIINVKDTGVGIPKEEINKIFEPFYRVDKSRSRKIGGSGVGLALVSSIIEKHRGSISVSSDEGGSIFEVKFNKYTSLQ